MADGYFFAVTLDGEKPSEVWDPEVKDGEEDEGGHQLIIKQALCDPKTKDGELNVVQVDAMTYKDSVHVPIAILKAGGPQCQINLDLSFPDPPVTFTLVQGKGPVHIIGHHLIASGPDFQEIEEEMIDEDEECEEEAEEEEDEPKSKKAKSNSKGSPTKNSHKGKK